MITKQINIQRFHVYIIFFFLDCTIEQVKQISIPVGCILPSFQVLVGRSGQPPWMQTPSPGSDPCLWMQTPSPWMQTSLPLDADPTHVNADPLPLDADPRPLDADPLPLDADPSTWMQTPSMETPWSCHLWCMLGSQPLPNAGHVTYDACWEANPPCEQNDANV